MQIKVRVRKDKLWERGSVGLFTPGMEETIDSSLLANNSALNEIVEIVSPEKQAPVKESVEPVVEAEQEKKKDEVVDDTEIIENAEKKKEVIEESVKGPSKSIKSKLLNLGKKKSK